MRPKQSEQADKIDEIADQLDDIKAAADDLAETDEGGGAGSVRRLQNAVDHARGATDELEDREH